MCLFSLFWNKPRNPVSKIPFAVSSLPTSPYCGVFALLVGMLFWKIWPNLGYLYKAVGLIWVTLRCEKGTMVLKGVRCWKKWPHLCQNPCSLIKHQKKHPHLIPFVYTSGVNQDQDDCMKISMTGLDGQMCYASCVYFTLNFPTSETICEDKKRDESRFSSNPEWLNCTVMPALVHLKKSFGGTSLVFSIHKQTNKQTRWPSNDTRKNSSRQKILSFKKNHTDNPTSEPRKRPFTFRYTDWLIGLLIMVYYNPYITG